MVMNLFVGCAYLTALLGGYISDTYLGKYKTILDVSLVYCCGGAVLSVTAIHGLLGDPPSIWGVALGLSLIALGTGGIKPCVSAFVGDQFTSSQAHLLEQMFRVFYFCINLGSFVSTLLTPLIRTKVDYAAAFAVPSGLLLVATCIFFSGRNKYVVRPPQGSVMSDAVKVIYYKFLKRAKYGSGDSEMTPLVDSRFSKHFVDDVTIALRVLLVFAPIPIFWATYNQCQVRWIFQANAMDLKIWPNVELTADQVPALNPILILLLIPLYDRVIYPGIQYFRPFHPLARMVVGQILLTGSFILSGFVQIAIDEASPNSVPVGLQVPQYVVQSAAEVMVSITGLEFAYTQAPKSMKSIMMSGWLLAVAVGSYLSAAFAASPLDDRWNYFMYAIVQVAGTALFVVTGIYYVKTKHLYVSADESGVLSLPPTKDVGISTASSSEITPQ